MTADVIPPRLFVNLVAPGVDTARWRIPQDLVAQAAFVIDGSGVHERPEAVLAGPFTEAPQAPRAGPNWSESLHPLVASDQGWGDLLHHR